MVIIEGTDAYYRLMNSIRVMQELHTTLTVEDYCTRNGITIKPQPPRKKYYEPSKDD